MDELHSYSLIHGLVFNVGICQTHGRLSTKKVHGNYDIFACHTLPKFGVFFLPPHRNWPTPTVDFQSEQISGWHDDRKKLKFRVRLKICKCRLLWGSSIYDINSGDGCRKTKAKLREVA